jgi:hypothetical protein
VDSALFNLYGIA